MVTSGSGEEVTPDTIKEFNRWSTAQLSRYAQGGLSDQRTALVRTILANRAQGVETPATKQFAEQFPERGQASVGSRQQASAQKNQPTINPALAYLRKLSPEQLNEAAKVGATQILEQARQRGEISSEFRIRDVLNAPRMTTAQAHAAQRNLYSNVINNTNFQNQVKNDLQNQGLTKNEATAVSNAALLSALSKKDYKINRSEINNLLLYFQQKGNDYLRSALRKGGGNLYAQALRGYNILSKTKGGKAVNKGLDESKKILDFYSGGRLTEKKLDKEQEKLNKEYETLDQKYGGKELSESEYQKASSKMAMLDYKQQQLDLARENKGAKFDKAFKLTPPQNKRNIILGALGFGPEATKTRQRQGLQIGNVLANALITAGETPSMVKAIRKDPKILVTSIKGIPAELKKGVIKDVQVFKVDPQAGIMRVATQAGIFYYANKFTDKGFKITGKITRQGVSRLSPYFRELETTPLGIRTIQKVPGIGKIELIEERGTRLRKVNPERAVVEANLKGQLKPKPILPKVNSVQKKILQIIKRKGDVVSGSYAQNVFLKRKFNRPFQDLDILTIDRKATIQALRKRFGKRISFHKKLKSIEVKYKGKTVADLVEFAEGEKVKGGKSFVQKYGFAKVKGLNVVRPQVRLASKVGQLGIGKRGKVLKDISLLYGKKKGLPFKRPSFTGPYTGVQAKVGTRRTLTSSQADLFGRGGIPTPEQAAQRIRDIILRKKPSLKLKKWFYATPDIEGVAQARVTRLGLPGKQEASLIDLFSKRATLTRGKPTIFVLPKEKIFKAPRGISKGKIIKTKGFVVPGFSRELEVVLGKNFLIQQGKKLGTTLVDGEKVSIVQLKKIKIPKVIKKEIKAMEKLGKRLESQRISSKARNKILNKLKDKRTTLGAKIKKITKIDYSRRSTGKPIYPLGRKIASRSLNAIRRSTRRISSNVRRGIAFSRGVSSGVSRRGGSIGRSTSIIKRGGSGSVSRGGSSAPRGVSRRGGISYRYRQGFSPSKTPIKIKSFVKGKERIRVMSKAIPSFNVFAKVGRKFVKINKGLLSKTDALSRGSFAIDNTTAKTFKIISAGKRKKIASLPNTEKNYYQRASFKLREYRLSRGKKFSVIPKYIERRRYGIDTRGEKKGLTIASYLKSRGYSKSGREAVESQRIRGRTQVAVPRTFKRVRRISASQRKVMLKNLAKARRVLARRRR